MHTPNLQVNEKNGGGCSRLLVFVTGLTVTFSIFVFSTPDFAYKLSRFYGESANDQANDVGMANLRVAQMFGNEKYADKFAETYREEVVWLTLNGNDDFRKRSPNRTALVIEYADKGMRLAVLKYNIVPRSPECHLLRYFVIVHVRIEEKSTREQWRRTYSQLQREHSFNIVFATGLTPNKSLSDGLRDEAFIHRDILQANFIDTYRNLTLKNIAALRYVAAVCPTVQAIVKLDDDVAWNIQDTRSIVDDAIRTGRIHCANSSGYAVPRSESHPWHVTEEEYSGKRYPPHCTGFAYVMSREAFLSILEAASEERYFWIDDVFVTGVLADRSGVKHVGIWDKVSLHTKTLYHTWWSSNSTFTLVRKEDIETFFVITNADWMLKKYWYGSDNA